MTLDDAAHIARAMNPQPETPTDDFEASAIDCSRCGSTNVTIEQFREYSGVWYAGVGEMLTVEVATCSDCGLREEI